MSLYILRKRGHTPVHTHHPDEQQLHNLSLHDYMHNSSLPVFPVPLLRLHIQEYDISHQYF